jgi:hypothetical protein
VSEEPQERVLQEEEDFEPIRDLDATEEPAETEEDDDSDDDFEAHGSWGGIG